MSEKKRRSRLEDRFESILQQEMAEYTYETTKLKYVVPASNHVYNVDWTLGNGILVETKGRLMDYAERQKYILVKEQHPEADLRFVFVDNNKLVGGLKSTHADWAKKNGFSYCDIKDTETIKQWIEESK